MWTARGKDDNEQRVLVIVTTVKLDPAEKGYKKSLVDKLSRAARDYLAETKEVESFMLVNRFREWRAPKG